MLFAVVNSQDMEDMVTEWILNNELDGDEDRWEDEEWGFVDIRQGVARNTKITVELFNKLAIDEDEWVRIDVARNSATPLGVLDLLAKDESELVRERVIENLEKRKIN